MTHCRSPAVRPASAGAIAGAFPARGNRVATPDFDGAARIGGIMSVFGRRADSEKRRKPMRTQVAIIGSGSSGRLRDEMRRRLPADVGEAVVTGLSFEKSIAPLRSFVEPMPFIVPPTAAKGLKLAASDIRHLFDGLREDCAEGSSAGLAAYSARALARVGKAERFSWWMTTMLHSVAEDAFGRCIHDAELAYTLSSVTARTAPAENYVGLPY